MNRFLSFILFSSFALDTFALQELNPYQAITKTGKRTTVCGLVSSIKYSVNSNQRPTFINLGPEFPNHVFTIVIWGDVRDSLTYSPESLAGKNICITASISKYKGKAQTELTAESQLKIK